MYLFLDTTDRKLNIGLFDDNNIIENYSKDAFKSQSEEILPTLDALLKKHQLSVDDIKKVIITKGPGSYTGVRIAMTLAKVLCSLKKIDLYTLSTLQAMAGKEKACSIIDARSNRVFIGFYENGKSLKEEKAIEIEKVKNELDGYKLVGDSELFGVTSKPIDLLQNVIDLKDEWEYVENVHTLVPHYCKDMDSYGK